MTDLVCSLGLVVVIAGFGVTPATAQTDAQSSRVLYWLYAGPSLTTLGVGASGGVSIEADRHVFSLRATTTDPTFGHETWDVGLLYGRALFVQSFTFSASTGIAIVSGTRYGSLFGRGPGRDLETMIGFPLEGVITWTPTPVFGVGVRGVANVNTGQPFGGLGVTLQVGRLR